MNPFKQKILDDLIRLGITRTDALMVHSSLRALGTFQHKARILVESLLEILGPDGTLMIILLAGYCARIHTCWTQKHFGKKHT